MIVWLNFKILMFKSVLSVSNLCKKWEKKSKSNVEMPIIMHLSFFQNFSAKYDLDPILFFSSKVQLSRFALARFLNG